MKQQSPQLLWQVAHTVWMCVDVGWFTSMGLGSEISSDHSEQHTAKNVRIVYSWDFPFNVFRQWLITGT